MISHGGGEHSGRYEHVADRLTDAGYAVWALDHRGHGLSGGERMRFDSVAPLAADLRTMVGIAAAARARRASRSCWRTAWARRSASTTPATTRTSSRAWSSPGRSPRSTRRRRCGWRRGRSREVAPGRGIFKVDPETVSRDPEVVRAYDSDPLNFHGSFPAESIVALERAGMSFPERLPR